MIPHIIHQTWKNERIPQRFQFFADSWRRFHPDWEWRLWTDRDNLRFVKEVYPMLLDRYLSYPYNIQRVDLVRYLIIRTYGGVYADMDLQCFRHIQPLLDSYDCVFSFEHELHAIIHNVPFIVSNAFIASASRHPIFDLILEEVLAYSPICTKPDKIILETTGPLMLTRLFQRIHCDDGLKLLDSRHLFSLPLSTIDMVRASDLSLIESILAKDIYGLHWHDGTWWRSNKQPFLNRIRSRLLSLVKVS